jgi:hypothetical protein
MLPSATEDAFIGCTKPFIVEEDTIYTGDAQFEGNAEESKASMITSSIEA